MSEYCTYSCGHSAPVCALILGGGLLLKDSQDVFRDNAISKHEAHLTLCTERLRSEDGSSIKRPTASDVKRLSARFCLLKETPSSLCMHPEECTILYCLCRRVSQKEGAHSAATKTLSHDIFVTQSTTMLTPRFLPAWMRDREQVAIQTCQKESKI